MPQHLLNLISLANQFQIQTGDWLRIPFGDHPHPKKVIQRLDQAAAAALVASFNSFRSRLGRLFGGFPAYVGHPDVPEFANEYLDKKAYGWIMDIEARVDGVYLKMKWSAAGEELVANAHYKWFSPYWGCEQIAVENNVPILRPIRLASIGLTNYPNITGLMPMANETDVETNPQQKETEMLDKIRKLLGLANDAAEEPVIAAITTLKSERDAAKAEATAFAAGKATAETALANATTAKTAAEAAKTTAETQAAAAKTQAAAERKARVDLIVLNAIEAGKITPAQKDALVAELIAAEPAALETRLTELANAKPVLNVDSKTAGLGARNGQVIDRVGQIQMLVNEKRKTVPNYDDAFAAVKKENPALFNPKKQKEI